ncbi:uncharacterized protein V1518DRAFT_420420 [Limtongia smithiae]|uniref:uncharacterized protein n=1 Tax=Limtongia smithiae TaxID=1125753 RepID=UPI0034CF6A4D
MPTSTPPPPLSSLMNDILTYTSIAASYIHTLTLHIRVLLAHIHRVAAPPLKSLLTSDPDLLSVALLLVILWLSLLVLNQAARMAYGVVALAMKLAVLAACVGSVVWFVFSHGDTTAQNVSTWDIAGPARLIRDYLKNL